MWVLCEINAKFEPHKLLDPDQLQATRKVRVSILLLPFFPVVFLSYLPPSAPPFSLWHALGLQVPSTHHPCNTVLSLLTLTSKATMPPDRSIQICAYFPYSQQDSGSSLSAVCVVKIDLNIKSHYNFEYSSSDCTQPSFQTSPSATHNLVGLKKKITVLELCLSLSPLTHQNGLIWCVIPSRMCSVANQSGLPIGAEIVNSE